MPATWHLRTASCTSCRRRRRRRRHRQEPTFDLRRGPAPSPAHQRVGPGGGGGRSVGGRTLRGGSRMPTRPIYIERDIERERDIYRERDREREAHLARRVADADEANEDHGHVRRRRVLQRPHRLHLLPPHPSGAPSRPWEGAGREGTGFLPSLRGAAGGAGGGAGAPPAHSGGRAHTLGAHAPAQSSRRCRWCGGPRPPWP